MSHSFRPLVRHVKVRLSKLKLAGFKTFVDPTTVSTPGQLVGVVGPNGCGKSNIIDAVRWVLGEMRASALRGGSMQDVIFNGASTRKPVSRASVELVFDNSAGRAGGHWSRFSEIAVKRVLDRSGDSSYHINNLRVRRKDVVDLFLGTGLGPKAYAIIEQGMISRIIEARPDEIRAFLEEAASVSRYRERRKETEGRLRDAHANLLRLDDVRIELGERLQHLDEQARVAREYRALSAQHDHQQQLLWLFRLEAACDERTAISARLNELSSRLESDNARVEQLETACEQYRDEHQRAVDATQQAQSELFAASAEVSRFEGEVRHHQTLIEKSRGRLQNIRSEQAHWQQELDEMQSGHQRWDGLLENARFRAEQLSQQHEEAVRRQEAAENSRRQADEAAATARDDLARCEQQYRVEQTRHASSQRTLDTLMSRHQRLEVDSEAIEGPDATDLERVDALVESLQAQHAETEQMLEQALLRLRDSEEAQRSAGRDERETQRDLTELLARHKALARLQAQSRSQGKLGEWLQQHGVDHLQPLWQSLRVEAGWELALEAALGSRLRALPGDAKFVQILLAHAPTEALTLYLDTENDGGSAGHPPMPPGITPMLARLVRIDAALAPLLQHWLRRCYSVTSIEKWIDHRDALPSDWLLFDPHGRILSRRELSQYRTEQASHDALARAREIEELEAVLERLEAEAEQALERFEAQQAATAEQAEAVQSLQQQARDLQQQLHAEQVEQLRLTQQCEHVRTRRAQIHAELVELTHALTEERETLLQLEQQLEGSVEDIEIQRERVSSLESLRFEREQSANDGRAMAQSVAHELQEAHFSERECLGKLDDLARSMSQARQQLQRLEREQQEQYETLDDDVHLRIEQALETSVVRHAECEALLATCRDRQEALAARLREAEEQRLSTEQAMAPLRNEVAEARLAHQAAELAAEQHRQRLEEDGADVTALQPVLSQVSSEADLQREVTRLHKQIQTLGAVNLAAIEELESAQQRKNYLDEQHDDLSQAIETLQSAIRRIDRETREQLQQTYDTVNEQFGTLFPRLFGGGHAALEMTGDEILDAGIRIVAQPPGKKNSSIHLLSGGEKALTAIALVFAMFRLNPAPFCMLDEVDAPLDDANTERYCRLVRHMSSETQFIFISHNKVTMEMAQQLVGVTMQEQGVSRIVEVDIEKALEMAQPEVA